MAGKLCGFALRIAANLHITEEIIKATANTIISEKTMNDALEIAARLSQHAIAAYSFMGADQNLLDAQKVFEVIKTLNDPFSKTELNDALRHRRLSKKERPDKAIGILIERNILKKVIDESTRKPTTIFLINPKLKNGD